jgi:type IV pilus assembly protein PilZ
MTDRTERRDERLHHELLVAYKTVGGFVSEWAVNVSKGGLFINTPEPLPIGTAVKLIVNLPGAKFPFDLEGRVAWVEKVGNGANVSPGMGIEFVGVDEAVRAQIQGFVEKLRSTLGPAGQG